MKHRELFPGDLYPAGLCVACDAPLAGRRPEAAGVGGAPRSVLCGSVKCKRTYWVLRRARIAELAARGLALEQQSRESGF